MGSRPADEPASRPLSGRYTVGPLAGLPYPLRQVLRRWQDLLGMVIGVGIALGIGMTLLAVSRASVELFTSDFRQSGADLYVVRSGGTIIAVLPGDTPGTIDHARSLLTRLRALPGVRSVVGVMSWSMKREREGPRRSDEPTELVAVMGVDGEPEMIPGALVVEQGRWLRRSNEVFLGSKLSRERGLRLGDTLRLNSRDFTVVGSGKLRGFGFSADAVAYLDYHAFAQRAPVGDVVSIVAIDAEQPAAAGERIAELDSLSVFTPADLVAEAERVNAIGVVMRLILNVLTLTIAALFVSNMLSHSVAERRLEFATLRAIGLPSRTILLSVSLEAALISLAAAFVGAGLSLGLGWWINVAVARQYGIESLYAADAVLFALVFLLALGLGLVAGLFPARQATRVDPVDVLREA
jgi:ABC-type antimicrobial peptide transport system permease subunit